VAPWISSNSKTKFNALYAMSFETTIGQHCSFAGCGLRDFLPFPCDRCKNVYCKDHRSYVEHACPVKVPDGPPEFPAVSTASGNRFHHDVPRVTTQPRIPCASSTGYLQRHKVFVRFS
jgi:hypothetical protein